MTLICQKHMGQPVCFPKGLIDNDTIHPKAVNISHEEYVKLSKETIKRIEKDYPETPDHQAHLENLKIVQKQVEVEIKEEKKKKIK